MLSPSHQTGRRKKAYYALTFRICRSPLAVCGKSGYDFTYKQATRRTAIAEKVAHSGFTADKSAPSHQAAGRKAKKATLPESGRLSEGRAA
jgi:hypothetical protein